MLAFPIGKKDKGKRLKEKGKDREKPDPLFLSRYSRLLHRGVDKLQSPMMIIADICSSLSPTYT